jgi:DNA-binding LytR/AlgR family response regulator
MSKSGQVGIVSDHFPGHPVTNDGGDPRRAGNAGGSAQYDMAALHTLPAFVNRQPPRVAIKLKGRILFINPSDVVTVEAEGNYVLLQRVSSSYLLRESISAVAEKLEPYGFIRIHRSVLVNTSFVEEIRPFPTGEYGLRVKGGKEYKVTRTYKKELKLLAESWLGTDSFVAE